MASSVVYGLLCPPRRTYVGVTNKLDRRLRQHNGVIKGGARATRMRQAAWRVMYVVRGLPDRRACLQLEWRLHRRHQKTRDRMHHLQAAFALPRFTRTAVPVADLPPESVIVEWHDAPSFVAASGLAWPPQVKHALLASQARPAGFMN